MTDEERRELEALVTRAENWLRTPGRNMLNDTDDLVLRLTIAVRGLRSALLDDPERKTRSISLGGDDEHC